MGELLAMASIATGVTGRSREGRFRSFIPSGRDNHSEKVNQMKSNPGRALR
jgi:hypothetical protein